MKTEEDFEQILILKYKNDAKILQVFSWRCGDMSIKIDAGKDCCHYLMSEDEKDALITALNKKTE